MSDSALVLPRGLETGIPVPTQRRATWAPGSPRTVGLETQAPGPRPPSVRRSSKSAALAPVLTSFPFWLLLSERADVGGERKGREGPGVWRGGGGGVQGGAEKPGTGSVLGRDRGPETDGNCDSGAALPPPVLSRRPHGPTPLTPAAGHAPAAPAAAVGHEPPRGSRAEQLPESRPRRGWGPRWPGRGRGAGGGGRRRRRRGEAACVPETLPLRVCPCGSSCLRPCRASRRSRPLCPRGEPRRFRGSVRHRASGACPAPARRLWLAGLRVAGPLRPCRVARPSGRGVQAPVSVWEEEEDGATFTVTSRQYQPLDPLAPRPPPRSSRKLRAGTLEALVRYLLDTRTSGTDMTFTAAFLATHRAFTSTPALLGLMADRLEALESHPADELERTKGVAISVLSTWLASHPEDFGSEVKGQLDRLESFFLRTGYAAGEGIGEGGADLIRNLRSRVDPQTPELPKPLALPGDPPADPTDVLVYLADHLAEQLTLLDAELFLNLVPSQCLGGLWGHRDRPGHSHLCPSVRATVTQFNKVAGAVVSSVLGATSTGEGLGEVTVRPLRPPQRARLLEKWIRVAEECRLLRNFSSVYAVVSALQSSPIHRLRAAWGEASRDSLRVFSSLCQIFSEEDNYSQSRELLLQEVKLQPSLEPNSKKSPRSASRGGGVVPYLGTFLKDLVMLDAASKDELENGYINFDKRRKEFAVLSELRRLQNECRGYDLRPDPDIQRWLQGLRPLTEAQSHRVSCEVETPGSGDPPAPRVLRPTLVISQWTEVLGSVGGPTPLVSWDRPSVGAEEVPGTPAPLLTRLAQHMKWPSVSSLDSALESTPALQSPADPSHLSPPASSPRPSRGHRRSASCGSPLSGGAEGASRGPGCGGGAPGPGTSDCRIIRVQMELGEDGSVYKSVLVTSQDKAPSVISRVLKKNNRDSAVASEYELVQLLPGERELTIPASANVFYAMDGASHDFLLRQRRRPSSATVGLASGPSASGTPPSEGGGGSFPRIKATGRKIARALF